MAFTRQRSQTDGHWWYRSILICGIVTSSLALLFQFIGFVMPGWIVLTLPSGMSISAGPWYIQVCDSRGRCRTASMTTGVNPFNVAGDSEVVLLTIPVGRLLDVIVNWDSAITYEVPYSLVCTTIGGAFCCFYALTAACALCMVMLDMRRDRLNTDEMDGLTVGPT